MSAMYYPDDQRNDGARIDALRVVVSALGVVQRVHVQLRFADEEIIADHDAGHRPQ